MMELPEAAVISEQIARTITGKRIASVEADRTPHKLAWFFGDKAAYQSILSGGVVGGSSQIGGFVEMEVGKARILFSEGVNIRYQENGMAPPKHQLLVRFEDGSALSGSVQMYGGMGAFIEGELDNKYYLVAKEKPSPLAKRFDWAYFKGILEAPGSEKLSMKALLATEQRIPGLGNGVLQDILFRSRLGPKRRVGTLTGKEMDVLYQNVKGTLGTMAEQGGRDTESDLFGTPGGYAMILSKKTVDRPCPSCGSKITKESYMGGAVYYCPECQKN